MLIGLYILWAAAIIALAVVNAWALIDIFKSYIRERKRKGDK